MFEGDMVVPRDRMVAFLDEVEAACTAYNLTAGCFGHLGDGNVHVNVLRADLSD
jgi:glycolate oxidase